MIQSNPRSRFLTDETGALMPFIAMAIVAMLGFLALILDIGRLATTQAELQSYVDSVALTAAAELDGRPDALERARHAARTHISDDQTFATGARALDPDAITLTFYRPALLGRFSDDPTFHTTSPAQARYVAARIDARQVALPFAAALSGTRTGGVDARAVAGFSVEACDATPVAVCLPSVDFNAAAAVGSALELQASLDVASPLPGQVVPLDALAPVDALLSSLNICAGLLGATLEACLIGNRKAQTACSGRSELAISAKLDGADVLDAVDSRFGAATGLLSTVADTIGLPVAPNPFGGTSQGGLCEALSPAQISDLGRLPLDDCQNFGGCGIVGDGDWTAGRAGYVDEFYDGVDPFPQAQSRYEFYRAQLAAQDGPVIDDGGTGGGLLGGVTDLVTGPLCTPVEPNGDATARLMVLAAVDCSLAADGQLPPPREFLEVFALGQSKDGTLSLEVTACLGGNCGGGELNTQVRDVVRLVE